MQATDINKVAIVTGGSGILGAVLCKALASNGYKVAILGRDINKAETLAHAINASGGIALAIAADVTDKQSLESASQKILDTLGNYCLLINGAGGNHPRGTCSQEHYQSPDKNSTATSFFDLDTSGIDFVFQVNFMGTLLPCQVFGKNMLHQKHATIINVSSLSALAPITRVPAYSAAKAAVNNFTQWLAVHFAATSIRVNAIAPGFFLTEQNRALLTQADGSWTPRAIKVINHTPMGRLGNPSELVGTVLWLANEQVSGFVNGTVIVVDGGFSAYAGI